MAVHTTHTYSQPVTNEYSGCGHSGMAVYIKTYSVILLTLFSFVHPVLNPVLDAYSQPVGVATVYCNNNRPSCHDYC